MFLSALETPNIYGYASILFASSGKRLKVLTKKGFLIVFARLSDIFGRKNNLLIAVGFFTIWSLACGLSQTIDQL